MRHILWDWNGTLLDDTEAALDTLNEMIAARGGKPIAMDFYRDRFAFPVKPFYDTIGISAKDDAEWDAIAREYHEVYSRQPKKLNALALEALGSVRAAGLKQWIISALRQDLLERDVAHYGVSGFFEGVYGTDNLDGSSKIGRARELLARIGGPNKDIVLIGDALHDKEVADALGIRCILCAQGSHAAWRLERVAPTGATLVDAVGLALRTPSSSWPKRA